MKKILNIINIKMVERTQKEMIHRLCKEIFLEEHMFVNTYIKKIEKKLLFLSTMLGFWLVFNTVYMDTLLTEANKIVIIIFGFCGLLNILLNIYIYFKIKKIKQIGLSNPKVLDKVCLLDFNFKELNIKDSIVQINKINITEEYNKCKNIQQQIKLVTSKIQK